MECKAILQLITSLSCKYRQIIFRDADIHNQRHNKTQKSVTFLSNLTILFLADESVSTSHTNVIVTYKAVQPVVSRIKYQFVFGGPTFAVVTNESFA